MDRSLSAAAETDWKALETDWRRIAGSDPACTVFQSWEWTAAERANLPNRESLYLVARSRPDGIARAIIPLGVTGSFLFRKLALLGAGDYLDGVAEPEYRAAAREALLGYLRRGAPRWAVADFRCLAADGLLAGLAARSEAGAPVVQRAGGLRMLALPHQAYPGIVLPATWEEFESRLGKKFRWQMGYDLRRMGRDVGEPVIRLATPETIAADLGALMRLHQARWTSQGKPGIFAEEGSRKLHIDLASALLAAGKLRLYTMEAAETAIASLYCFQQNGSVCYYQSGFDADYSRFSPNKALIARAIRDAIAGGARYFDFLKGDESYKTHWATEPRETARILVVPLRPLPLLVLQALRLEPRIKRWLKARKSNRETGRQAQGAETIALPDKEEKQ